MGAAAVTAVQWAGTRSVPILRVIGGMGEAQAKGPDLAIIRAMGPP